MLMNRNSFDKLLISKEDADKLKEERKRLIDYFPEDELILLTRACDALDMEGGNTELVNEIKKALTFFHTRMRTKIYPIIINTGGNPLLIDANVPVFWKNKTAKRVLSEFGGRGEVVGAKVTWIIGAGRKV